MVRSLTLSVSPIILTVIACLYTPARGPVPLDALAFDPAAMDTSAGPCDDFDRFANGRWLDHNPVPPTESRWGSFNILAKENLEVKVRGIIEELLTRKDLPTGTDEQLIADLYRSYMDTGTIEQLGASPLKPYFDRIDAITSVQDHAALAGRMQRMGVGQWLMFSARPDMRNSRVNTLFSAQGGLSLGERSYYDKMDTGMVRIRAEFVKYVDTLFGLAGLPEKDAGARILAFETALAQLQLTNIQARDPQIWTRMAFADYVKLAPGVGLAAWTKELGLSPDSLMVQDRDYVTKASAYVAAAPIAMLRTWMKWKVLSAYAGSLNKAVQDADFRFNATVMRGEKEQRPRDQQALRMVDQALGEPIGKLYAAKYFPPSSRKRVEEMIENVRTVYAERIKASEWMGPETKIKALEKLAAFTPRVGYPDVWKDHSSVRIAPNTLVANRIALNEWRSDDNLRRVGKPVDRKEWGMTPQMVNASYSSSLNAITFPAGILQPPFFSADADDAINYGGIMSVIGHELTHGFDDQGSKFDADGNLVNWWTDADRANFKRLSGRLITYFDRIEVMPGVHIKGGLTVGENIADLGGLTLAYHALVRSMQGKPEPAPIDGLTWKQRFFLGYAQIWRNTITPEEMRRRIETDPHSPGRYRINATLGQLEEFRDVWCTGGTGAMVVPDTARVVIW